MPRNPSKRTSNYIWDRDEGFCIYCKHRADVIDHVIPVIAGGPTHTGNLVLACIKCNSNKGKKLHLESLIIAIFYLSTVGEDTDWMDTWLHRSGNKESIRLPATTAQIDSISTTRIRNIVPQPVGNEPIESELHPDE